MEDLQAADVPALLAEFRQQPLTYRKRVIWALAYLGGAEVRDEFIRKLEADYQLREFDDAERSAILRVAKALGLVSRNDDEAFRYILDHTTPENWTGMRRWNGPRNRDSDDALADQMVVALGLSGRPEADEVLQSVLAWDPRDLKKVDGGLMDAHFYLATWRDEGMKKVIEYCATIEGFSAYGRWHGTEEAKRFQEEIHKRLGNR